MKSCLALATLAAFLGLLPASSYAQGLQVFYPPFASPAASLNACASQDTNCNNPSGTFRVGDLIEVYVGNWNPGIYVLYSPTDPSPIAATYFCGPFNYGAGYPPLATWDFYCQATFQFSGDLGNLSTNADPNSGAFETSFSAPGIYTISLTAYAMQVGPNFSFPNNEVFVPTNVVNATGTITITVLPDDQGTDADLGPCTDCEGEAGGPINVMTGNVWIPQRDYSLPGLGGGLQLVRTWNSQWQDANPVALAGMFGDSWRSTYEEQLTFPATNTFKYWRGDGSVWTFSYDNFTQSYSVSSPPNERATIQFDGNSNQYTMVLADGTKRIFSSLGYLLSVADRNNNQTARAYDQGNRMIQVTDPAGRSITLNYNGNQVSSVQDLVGTIATYTYDSSARLTRVTYADGSSLNFAYDSNSMITGVTDTQGKILEAHTYDVFHRGLTSTRANGADSLSVHYDNSGGPTTLTDSLANTTQFGSGKIGGRHFVNSVVETGCSSCGARSTSYFGHDGQGNRTSSTDALGLNTSYTYDSMGNVLIKFINPCGGGLVWNFNPTSVFDEFRPEADFPEILLPEPEPQSGCSSLTWTYTYNLFQEVLTATDPAGNVTTNTYDSSGNLLSTTSPSPDGSHPGSATTLAYDSKGELTSVADPRGNLTSISYTPAGLIASTTDAQNHSTTLEYDARGNRLAVTDALGNSTTFTYDVMNRLTQTTQPGSVTTTFGYDYRGRRTTVTDPNGKATHYAYDDADRQTSVTDAAGNATAYWFDTENNLTTLTDAAGHATSFSYDPQGRTTSVTFPVGRETYSYDSLGNLLSKTDRNGHTITYLYDKLDRVTGKQYPDSTGVNYAYDILSHLTQVVDSTGTYDFTYDNMGRLTQASTQYSFLSGQTLVNHYTYDADSNRASLANPQGGVTSYGYDSLNHLTNVTDFAGRLFAFNYDALGRRTGLTRPNGVNTSYTYDSLSRLLSVLHQAGSTMLDGVSYAYDAAGNRTAKTTLPGNLTYSYNYDPVYELTQATRSSDGKATEKYTYDAVGNRLTQPGVPYVYNVSNEMTSREGVPYTYDASGNALSKTNSGGATSYAWDFENRLTSVSKPDGSVLSFRYDPFGRRIQKSSPSGTTTYVYDGDNIIEELNGATGTLGERYTYGPGIDEPLVGQRQPQIFYYDADGLGSITSLTTPTGSVAATYTYDSFGFMTGSTGSATNWFRYTARQFDSDTGLYNYRARYVDPTIGRFISEDPIRFMGGTNFYRYVGNSPLDFVDPFGLCPPKKQQTCQDAILNAVNNQFGTNFTAADVQSTFTNGGAVNLVINGTGLPASQFNSIQTGRSPNGFLGAVIGYGPSLHIAGPAPLDPSAVFNSSNIGGATSVTFTAHIDSAWAYNPIGALLHYFIDVRGQATRNPCP
jgi:RHS repeat-associated protein